MSTLALWLPLIPLLSAAVIAAVSLSGRGRATVPLLATVPTAVTAVLTFVILFWHGTGGVAETSVQYTVTGGPDITLGARVDGLAALIGTLVGVVATAVQLYSVTYMKHEPRYTSYAGLISLFTFAMLVVVYSNDLIILLVGWEIMGACSYFLIGHYWERHESRAASVKAFLVTKTGDVPFLLGILLLAQGAQSFRIGVILRYAMADPHAGYVTAGAILLIGGVMGKSAQVPLQTWLPDAMAGPTPISALIHAATMVAAGVYVVARLYPVFYVTPAALWILGIAGSVTSIAAALSAFAQKDLKRVLAYSTVSQLALMVTALAVGGRDAAVFHLMSHGGFKALLFLGAGVVIHYTGTGDLAELRGHDLRAKLPVTYWTMTIGLAALAGVPFFSGFFSKESVLGAAYETAVGSAEPARLTPPPPSALGWLVLIAGIVTVVLTAAYCLRTWYILFGVQTAEKETATEAPWQETGPLIVLAAITCVFGFLGLSRGWFASWLGDADGAPYTAARADAGKLVEPAHYYQLAPSLVTSIAALLALVLGLGLVYLVIEARPSRDPARVLGPVAEPAFAGFHADAVQNAVVVRPAGKAAEMVGFLDYEVVDAYVRGSGVFTRGLGEALRRVQNGNVQFYLTGVLTGVVVIAAALGFGR